MSVHVHVHGGKFDESKHKRANNGQFGAGTGKSHVAHKVHHERMMEHHAKRSYETLGKGSGPMYTEAHQKHEAARKAHMSAASVHHAASTRGGQAAYGEYAHELSKAAHEASQAAGE